MQIMNFKRTIHTFYKNNRRDFPWRDTRDPYKILVSEVMLQQTQTFRVLPKYAHFIKNFPDFEALARAPAREVLGLWSGLGYNRRALNLHKTAQMVVEKFGGILPQKIEDLVKLLGIGTHTAAAICAFAFNKPTVFVETNIRAVFIHHFFANKKMVTDREILLLVEKTLDAKSPREWYYALMDYGVHLKKLHKNPARSSAHHRKQAPFKDSDRRIRGLVLKFLLGRASASEEKIAQTLEIETPRLHKNLANLEREGFIKKEHGNYILN